jgi:hypothetical protein
MKAAHEGDRALLENKAKAIIAEPHAEILSPCVKMLEVGNLPKSSGGFGLLDHFLDPSQQPGVGDHGQILVEGFAK